MHSWWEQFYKDLGCNSTLQFIGGVLFTVAVMVGAWVTMCVILSFENYMPR